MNAPLPNISKQALNGELTNGGLVNIPKYGIVYVPGNTVAERLNYAANLEKNRGLYIAPVSKCEFGINFDRIPGYESCLRLKDINEWYNKGTAKYYFGDNEKYLAPLLQALPGDHVTLINRIYQSLQGPSAKDLYISRLRQYSPEVRNEIGKILQDIRNNHENLSKDAELLQSLGFNFPTYDNGLISPSFTDYIFEALNNEVSFRPILSSVNYYLGLLTEISQIPSVQEIQETAPMITLAPGSQAFREASRHFGQPYHIPLNLRPEYRQLLNVCIPPLDRNKLLMAAAELQIRINYDMTNEQICALIRQYINVLTGI